MDLSPCIHGTKEKVEDDVAINYEKVVWGCEESL